MRLVKSFEDKKKSTQEAFRAGKAAEMVPKMLRVLNRKTGIDFSGMKEPASFPIEYQNAEGKFAGYMSFYGTFEAIRLNFALTGSSDSIVSVDVFEKVSRTPTYTIEIPPQFNIVQVLDHIAMVLTGEYFDVVEESYKAQANLQERFSHRSGVLEWMQSDPGAAAEMARGRSRDWAVIQDMYLNWLSSRGIRESIPNVGTFQMYCRRAFSEMGDDRAADAIPHVNIRRGQPEQPITTNSSAEDEFEQEIMQNEHLEKYDLMKFYFRQMMQDKLPAQGVYLYGRGGIGKSYYAKEILGNLPQTYYTKGKVKGYEGLLTLLYKHREGEIIILDDILTNDDMKNNTIQNILKSILDPDTPRIVKVEKKQKRGDTGEAAPEVSTSDVIDFTSDAGLMDVEAGESMYNFAFNSKVIMITNFPKIPQPIQDRVYAISFLFTDEQVADIIQQALSGIDPTDVDINTKQSILDWIKRFIHKANQPLSFRLFTKVLHIFLMSGESLESKKWQRWALIELKEGKYTA